VETDDRGQSLSALVAAVVFALLLMTGLVIDGGAKSAADRSAEVLAAQAARAGTDASAKYRLSGSDGTTVALTAARQMLAGHPEMDGSVALDERGWLVVDTVTSVPTGFLSLIGIRELQGSGHAVAKLQRR